MGRFAVSRFAAVVALLLGSFTAPGAALLHGVAHQHEAEHRRAHAHEAGNGEATVDGQQEVRTVAPADHHADHPHVSTGGGVRSRVDGLAILRAEPVVLSAAREITVAARADIPHAALPRADPATGPPPRLRAPPAA